MNATLPPLLRRSLALAILLAAIAIAYEGVVQPLLDDYSSTRQSIEEMRDAIERYSHVASELAGRRQALTMLRDRQAQSEGFLKGTNDALIAAQIQNRVKGLVEASQGELKSTQVLPVQENGKFRRVTIRGEMSLNLAAAQTVIYGIESSSPVLFLDNLNIRPEIADRRRDHSGAEDPLLDVQFDVYGYAPKTEKSDTDSN